MLPPASSIFGTALPVYQVSPFSMNLSGILEIYFDPKQSPIVIGVQSLIMFRADKLILRKNVNSL